MNLLDAILQDPSLDPSFRRVFVAEPKKDYREIAFDKASPRRFTGEAQTGFGDIGTVGSERYLEVRDGEHADQLIEERRERDEAGL